MTKGEEELIAALNGDIQMWESMAHYFIGVAEITLLDGRKISGEEYRKQFLMRIQDHRELIGRIKAS